MSWLMCTPREWPNDPFRLAAKTILCADILVARTPSMKLAHASPIHRRAHGIRKERTWT